jgi:seryl-tRNA synthetase
MIDPKIIKAEPNLILEALQGRGKYNLAEHVWNIIRINGEVKPKIVARDNLRTVRKQTADEYGAAKKRGAIESGLKEINIRAEKINDKIQELEEEISKLLVERRKAQMMIPNLLHEDVPTGTTEKNNKEIRTWPKNAKLAKKGKTHIQIADTIDLARGAKLSGARFTVLRGKVATLERAIGNFFMDTHVGEHNYQEVAVPYIVRREALEGTGQLPKFEEDLFAVGDNMFLIPTAEVPVTNIYRNEIILEDDLPIKMVALTPCFRAEAGSAGKDTKGLIRQHQFNKTELVWIVKPEDADKYHTELLEHAESVLQKLEIPYRVVLHCGGETSFAAKKCYDIEVWLPSQNKYREISSVSQFGDFQARRANIKFRGKAKGQKSKLVNTLNGSGLAVGRTLVAILENYVKEDGVVEVPEVLRPYTKFDKIEF